MDLALAKHGARRARRDTRIFCEHYHSGLSALLHSDLVMTMPRTFAEAMANTMAITVLNAPVPLPKISACMYWHRRSDSDPLMQWFRSQLRELIKRKLNK